MMVLDAYRVRLRGEALPFDAAHAVGFGLAPEVFNKPKGKYHATPPQASR